MAKRTTSAVLPFILLLCVSAGCGKKEPPISEAEVKALRESALPATPTDPVWDKAPIHPAKLKLQDMVEPRLMEASTSFVSVQSVTDGRSIAFRLSWDDPTADDLPGTGRFSDACAVQFPVKVAADAPAPQMGETGRPVEITFWSAAFQAMVDGRKDDIHSFHPNAKVDHYPFEAASLKPGSKERLEMEKRYAPARALGNKMAGPRTTPTQDLIAEGPGTLHPAAASTSSGMGKRTAKGWSVLVTRPLPAGVSARGRAQAAFAVWQGSQGEVGARKMRTVWIPLALGDAP